MYTRPRSYRMLTTSRYLLPPMSNTVFFDGHGPCCRIGNVRQLDPVRLATNHGLTPRQPAAVRRIIILHSDRILEAWREHCGATE